MKWEYSELSYDVSVYHSGSHDEPDRHAVLTLTVFGDSGYQQKFPGGHFGKVISQLGEMGWELVSVAETDQEIVSDTDRSSYRFHQALFFKRPLK